MKNKVVKVLLYIAVVAIVIGNGILMHLELTSSGSLFQIIMAYTADLLCVGLVGLFTFDLINFFKKEGKNG